MKQFIKENRIFLIVAFTITVLSLLKVGTARADEVDAVCNLSSKNFGNSKGFEGDVKVQTQNGSIFVNGIDYVQHKYSDKKAVIGNNAITYQSMHPSPVRGQSTFVRIDIDRNAKKMKIIYKNYDDSNQASGFESEGFCKNPGSFFNWRKL